MSAARLVFDGITLHDGGPAESEDGSYTLSVLAEGASFGEPAPVEVLFNSLMRDGALTKWDHDENREMSFFVQIDAPDGAALDAGLAVLHRATHKRTTLEFTPPDGYGETRIYDVLTSSLHAPGDYDDLGAMRGQVAYRLRIVAEPYWRTAGLVSETAEGIPSVGATINAAESLTGWSTPAAVVPGASFGSFVEQDPQPADMLAVDTTTFVEGAGSMAAKSYRVEASRLVGFLPSGDARRVRAQVTLTQAIAAAAGGYLSFAVKFDSTFGRTVTNTYWNHTYQETGTLDKFIITSAENGAQEIKNEKSGHADLLLQEQIVESLGDGWTRYTIRLPEALTISSLRWESNHLVPWTDDAELAERPRILVDQVALAESATLGQQVLKTIEIQGSARTVGSLHVAAPSDSVPLGQVAAFTVPRHAVPPGFRPDLRQWALPGATTAADATATHGSVFADITDAYGSPNSPIFEAPASLFAGEAHTMVARIKVASGTQFGIEAALVVDGIVIGTPETVYREWTPTVAGWEMVNLGTLYLPPVMIQHATTDAKVRFRFKGNDPALDEVYAFPVSGDLSIIDCGSGAVGPSASSHLWIDSPSADQRQGGYWRGTSASRQDALAAWSTTDIPGTHTFEAGSMLAFVACTGAQGPTVDFEYHPRRF